MGNDGKRIEVASEESPFDDVAASPTPSEVVASETNRLLGASGESGKVDPNIKRLFWLSCYMQFVGSLDRGILPGALPYVLADIEMTSTEAGSLNSVFLVGLCVALPLANYVSNLNRYPPFHLISCGLIVWITAVLACAFVDSFWVLAACRAFIGVGDSLFNVICVPFIDQNAPRSKRAQWMALFAVGYPLGIALGTTMSGAMASNASWRYSYFIEAALMAPAVVLGFCIKYNPHAQESLPCAAVEAEDITSSSYGSAAAHAPQRVSIWKTVLNPVLLLGCLGYAGLLGTSAGVGYWMIYYLTGTRDIALGVASAASGLTTLISSVLGTVIGGKCLDYMGLKFGGKSASMAYFFCSLSSLLCMPFFLAAWYTEGHQSLLFLFYGLGIVFMLMAGGTFPLALLWTVPKNERITVSSLFTFIVNVFGTVPLPIIVGWIKDKMVTPDDPPDYFPVTLMGLVTLWMVWPFCLAGTVGFLCRWKGLGTNVDTNDS